MRAGWRIASAGAIGYESRMASRFDRRSFLQGLVVTISAGAAACGDDETTTPEEVFSVDPADQVRVYAHGIASGDPQRTFCSGADTVMSDALTKVRPS